jgi:hypothetical protein
VDDIKGSAQKAKKPNQGCRLGGLKILKVNSMNLISVFGLQSPVAVSTPIISEPPPPNQEVLQAKTEVRYSVEDTWLFTCVWDDENTFSGELSFCLTELAGMVGVKYSEILQAWSEAHFYGFFENHNFWIAHESLFSTPL